MKRISMLILMLLVFCASIAWGQDNIAGGGTTNTIPQFKSETTIGDSPLFVLNGNSGIGTTTHDSTAPRIYDDFNMPLIDPTRWTGGVICWNSFTLECVRETHLGRLRLAGRTFGSKDSDEGIQYDTSYLRFRNPAAITSITTRLVVSKAHSVACVNNPEGSHSQAILIGHFFNTGGNSWEDDFQAMVFIEAPYWDPEAPKNELTATGVLSTAGQYFAGADLGTLRVGEEVIVSLRWDRPNHRFIAGLKKLGAPPTVGFMPYSETEAAPPVYPLKEIGVRNFVPNCTDRQTISSMTAYFDDVVVNVNPVP